MKNLSLLFIVFLFLQSNSLAQEGWFWQNPLPQGNDLNDICVFDQDKAIAVGDAGTVLKTTNGGLNWSLIDLGFNLALNSICFIDNNYGWIAGQCGVVFKTTDGGENWHLVKTDTSCGTFNIKSMHFVDTNTGWILEYYEDSAPPWLLKTTDSGETWNLQQYPFISLFMNDIYFIDELHGWIATGNTDSILATTDGGENWFTQFVGGDEQSNNFRDVFFVNENVGWIGGYDVPLGNKLFKTTNGGSDWDEQFIDTVWSLDYGTFSIYFVDENTGWLSANISGVGWLNGEIFKTTNGGEDWTSQYNSEFKTLSSIKFINDNVGWAVGRFGEALKTTNGGQEWNSYLHGYTTDLNSVFFVDENTGWTVGQFHLAGESQNMVGKEIILKTTNGGDEWISQYTATTETYLMSSHFIDNSTGWVVGSICMRTTNGGEDWVQQFNAGFNDVFFIDQNSGWSVGGESILYTTNGGDDWLPQFLAEDYNLTSIHFSNNVTGWAIGYRTVPYISNVYKTTNGGEEWLTDFTSNYFLQDVFFVDAMYGWIVGNTFWNQNPKTGVLFRTTNGGIDWIEISTPEVSSIQSVFFIDNLNGWAVNGSTIMRTTNGGDDWYVQVSPIGGANSIYFVDQDIGWVVGYGGAILKTTSGGVSFVEESEIDEIPNEYLLSNNYPNPFNPNTKIKYSVPQSTSVVIKVFDILGNEIETLMNEEKPAGTYEITWYAEGLPSGIYFYRIQAGTFVETKKMILIK